MAEPLDIHFRSNQFQDETRKSRFARFQELLSETEIDLRAVRRLMAQGGIPNDDPTIRSLIWQLFLGYLPLQTSDWEKESKRKHQDYIQFCNDLIINPADLSKSDSIDDPSLHRTTVSHEDHPLSTSDNSKWKIYFDDAEIRQQIERDVDRTHPDLNFFSGQTKPAEKHRAAMRRALFIFAKLNPGLRYVQGMNELLAIIFHTLVVGNILSTSSSSSLSSTSTVDSGNYNNYNDGVDIEKSISLAESGAFFCFIDIMSEFRDNFCQQLDNSKVGIKATMSKLSSTLKAFDTALWMHVERDNGVNPQFYAFRWIATLLTQEFPFPDVVRLWDVMLSDEDGRTDCLLRLCLAMVLLVRDDLLKGDFAANLKLLQNYPPLDVLTVIQKAEELRHFKTVIVLE